MNTPVHLGQYGTIRFLGDPDPDNENGIFREIKQHSINIDGYMHTISCLHNFNQPCSICDKSLAIFHDTNLDNVLARALMHRKTYVSNVLVIDCEHKRYNNSVQVIMFNKLLQQRIVNELIGYDDAYTDKFIEPKIFNDPCSLKRGHDFNFVYDKWAIQKAKFKKHPRSLDKQQFKLVEQAQLVKLESLIPPIPSESQLHDWEQLVMYYR